MSSELKIALVAPLRFIASPDWLDSLPNFHPATSFFPLTCFFQQPASPIFPKQAASALDANAVLRYLDAQ